MVAVALLGSHVYVADHGGLGLVVLRLEDDGSLVRIPWETEGPNDLISLAVHEPSATLFAAALGEGVFGYDLSDPAAPRLLPSDPSTYGTVRAVAVHGDELLLAAYERGLLAAPIDDGALGAPESVIDDVGVLAVTPFGEDVAVLTHDGTLRVGELQVPLDGPPLAVATDDTRVAVALGSGGVQLFERRGAGLERLVHLEPPGVVTHVDLEGDRVVAFALNGIFAYDVRTTPRLVGFHPSGPWREGRSGYFLGGLLLDDLVIASEWVHVSTFRWDTLGRVTALDHARGVYLPPDGPIRFVVRNVGSQPIFLRTQLWGRTLDRRTVPANAEEAIVIDAGVEARAAILDLVQSAGPGEPTMHRAQVVVLRREEEDDPARGRPAPGDPFPPLMMRAQSDDSLRQLPGARPARLVFYSLGCAAIWPELMDASWLAERGELDGGAELILASPDDERIQGYGVRWPLPMDRGYFYTEPEPSELATANARYGSGDTYFNAFHIYLPGDAHPTDYLLDGDGRVRAVERMYRGRYGFPIPD